MVDHDVAFRDLVTAAVQGPGALDVETRRRVLRLSGLPPPLADFVAKLALGAGVTGDDVRALREAGYSQDAVIEVTLCAALGVAQSRLKAGLAALEETQAW